MGECDQLKSERTDIEAAAKWHLNDLGMVFKSLFGELASENGNCERRRIDGAAELRPKVWNRA